MAKYITIFGIFLSSILFGQTDSNYVQKFDKTLTVVPYIDYKINQLNFDDDITNAELKYRTPQVPRIGLGATYKWMSLKGTFLPLYKGDQELKGATHQLDVQWNLYLGAFSSDIRYQSYEGYYLQNSSSINNWDMSSNGYYKREDLSVISFGTNLRYHFNAKKCSQKAAYSQTERQLKSAGSFNVGVRFNFLNVKADSSFVPSNSSPEFTDFNLEELKIYDQGIGLGYNYTFVKNNWFVSFEAMPYFLFQIIDMKKENTNEFKRLLSPQFTFQCRGAVGFNSEKNYCGITFVSDQMRSRWRDAQDIAYNIANIKLFYARRFSL